MSTIRRTHRLAALQLLSSKDAAFLQSQFLSNCGWKADAEPSDKEKSDIGDLFQRAKKINLDNFHARYPERKVPVHVVEVDETNPRYHALSIETAENSIRRQYTPDEVQGLFDMLIEAGFTHKNGRRKGDEKTVVGALKGILGKSDSQVRRMLKGEAKLEKSEWDAAVASFIRAALRVQRAKAEGTQKASDAGAIMRVVDTLLGTASGKRVRRRQALEGETSPSA